MKWYIASRTDNKDLVKSLIRDLKSNGHEIAYDWTNLGSLKPFSDNAEKCQKVAYDISNAIKDVDVFLLISDLGGTDMFVELGIAIAYFMKNNKPKIYVVGQYNKRSLMHLHPSITHCRLLKDILIKEGITSDLSY